MAAHEHVNQDQLGGYRGEHQPDTDVPMHDLTRLFPDDVYSSPHHYVGGYDDEHAKPAAKVVKQVGRNPDAQVSIFRAVPHGVTAINQGDWVTTVPGYAKQHGYHPTDEKQDWPVLTATVPAKHLSSGGNDLVEWGYSGPSINKAQFHE